jgi:multiple sugar transport system substrate-binding protein
MVSTRRRAFVGWLGGVVRVVGVSACAVVGLWWLFGDTVAKYRGARRDGRVISFSHFGGAEDYALWSDIIAAFEVEHPGIDIKQEFVPGWYGRYESNLRRRIVTGSTPTVALVQAMSMANFAEHFVDVSDGSVVRTSDMRWAPTSIESLCVAGANGTSLHGLPVSGGCLLIYWNPECIQRASEHRGAPIAEPTSDWTMDDFRDLARQLTCDFDGDGAIDQFGFWRPRWVYYLPFTWSFGARMVGDDGRWSLQGEAAEAALGFYRDLTRDHRVCPLPEETPQMIQDVGFLTSRVGMCVNGPWFMPFLGATRLRDVYRVAPIPRGPAGRSTRVTWDGLCVAKSATEAERQSASRFVEFCLSTKSQAMIAEAGRALPANTNAWGAFDGDGREDQRRPFIDAFDDARLQWSGDGFPVIDRVLNRRLLTFISEASTESPREFLDALRGDPVLVEWFGYPRD